MTSEKNKIIKTLDNDYVRSNPTKRKQIQQKKRVLKRRRLAVFFVFSAIIIGCLTGMSLNQKERLAAKQSEMQNIELQLQELEEQQEMLNVQIAKLEDDEYIAKLARKEYFLSDEGEIIFTIPDNDQTEKNDEKEEDEE